MAPTPQTTALLTGATLLAFAANSVLCRMALGDGAIDPASFTVVRVVGGALVLAPLAQWAAEPVPEDAAARSPWVGPIALFGYALCFSLAYLTLDTGTGALLLFGAVQVTMIGVGLWQGERPGPLEAVGGLAALGGLVWLVAPGVTAPEPVGALLMLISGVCWGVYSLAGRGQHAPIARTAANFVGASGLVLLPALWVAVSGTGAWTLEGLMLALLSGTVTSGLGYALWYRALRGHSATSAAIVQLAVPVIAAAGGVALLGESITRRLVVASVLTLGGIALAVVRKRPAS